MAQLVPLRRRLVVTVREIDEGGDYELSVFCRACRRSLGTTGNAVTIEQLLRAGRHVCRPRQNEEKR
jgi:hypothetical protein